MDKKNMYMNFSLQIFVILGSMDDGCLKWRQNKTNKKTRASAWRGASANS